MNNEPVMWMYVNKKTGIVEIIKNKSRIAVPHLNETPLYTHPVKEQLTDDEWIITYQTWALTSNDPLVLKRAILRKASEK